MISLPLSHFLGWSLHIARRHSILSLALFPSKALSLPYPKYFWSSPFNIFYYFPLFDVFGDMERRRSPYYMSCPYLPHTPILLFVPFLLCLVKQHLPSNVTYSSSLSGIFLSVFGLVSNTPTHKTWSTPLYCRVFPLLCCVCQGVLD